MRFSERIKSETPTPVLKGLFPDLGDLDLAGEARWEVPVLSGTYPLGVVDIAIPFTSRQNYGDGKLAEHLTRNVLAVEVKPTIDSVGALLRQVNLYKEGSLSGFGKSGSGQRLYWAVALPDTTWRDRIVAQRLYFIETPTPEDAKRAVMDARPKGRS